MAPSAEVARRTFRDSGHETLFVRLVSANEKHVRDMRQRNDADNIVNRHDAPDLLHRFERRAGRAVVDAFLKVVDVPEVFVVGDAASLLQNGHPVPGVAQAAIQEGKYVGSLIASELKGRKVKRSFRYFDKGNMAVVGKNYAVLERGRLRTSGFLTWLVWAFVHILSLPQLQNRLRVQHQWLWSYFTGQRSSRLIPEPPRTSNG